VEIIPLTSGQNRNRNLVGLGCCQNKDHIRRRFFQCLEQGIKRTSRKHMHLIDDIYFVPSLCRAIRNLFPNLSNIIHTVIGGSIDLDHIHGSTRLNGFAHLTFITRTSIHRMLTVDCFCQDLGYRCFTGTPCSAKKICMSDTVCVNLIGKRGHNVILPFDVFKIIGPELSVQGSITHEYTPLLLPGNIIFAEIFSGIKPPQENSRGGRCSLCYNSCQSPKLIPICLAALTI